MDSNQEMVAIDKYNDICKCQKPKQGITKAHQAIGRANFIETTRIYILYKNLVECINTLIILNKNNFFEKFYIIVKIINY